MVTYKHPKRDLIHRERSGNCVWTLSSLYPLSHHIWILKSVMVESLFPILVTWNAESIVIVFFAHSLFYFLLEHLMISFFCLFDCLFRSFQNYMHNYWRMDPQSLWYIFYFTWWWRSSCGGLVRLFVRYSIQWISFMQTVDRI